MTETQSKRIHAIVYSTDSREELAERITALEDENAKLRNGYGSMSREHMQLTSEHSDALYEIDRLKAENAKLRELCADFVRQIRLAEYFDCFGGNCEKWSECHGDCVFERRTRELGIEVKP